MLKTINKIKISEAATYRLRQLKGKTGLTPNILARFAFCHSINISGIPNPKEYDLEGMEFNRYTLNGPHDTLIISLLLLRMEEDNLPIEYVHDYFRAHICRGTMEIFPRVKTLLDLQNLIPSLIS
ncbi:MAG: DNA sulfur modification protein DndE [Candidatus Heimdallarchaeota archaeon]|nr:DNA sulfur modification protein DndE [Candidatus Heimdallarchaeota archaeon]